MKINFLPAFNGDCILITTDKFNILIDGGTKKTYSLVLKNELKDIKKLDLVILTHIDADHIMGLIELFKNDKVEVKKVWFNSIAKLSELFDKKYNQNIEYFTDDTKKDISCKQGESLEDILKYQKIDYELIYIEQQQKYIFEDLEVVLLSPYKENLKNLYLYWKNNIKRRIDLKTKKLSSKTNESSIAFLLKYKEKNYLFLADANIEVVTRTITDLSTDRIDIEFVKVSHHGSMNNTSQDFLNTINSNNFVILTNGQAKNYHPHKETLDMIILNAKSQNKNIDILFNYPKNTYRKKAFYNKSLTDEFFKLAFPKNIKDGLIYTNIKGFENGM